MHRYNLTVRINHPERREIEKAADALGIGVTVFVRRSALSVARRLRPAPIAFDDGTLLRLEHDDQKSE